MATLHASKAGGNWLTAASWYVCDSTSELDSEAANTALTTSYVSSSIFTPGAITVEGIAVKIASRNASPTGTMSIQLYNSSDSIPVAGTEVTINASDIPASTANGWITVGFTPVTLIAGKNYTVQAKTSVAGQVNLYHNATAANWSRQIITNVTQAPAAGDKIIVDGYWASPATKTDVTITMNETASTIYGNVSFPQSVSVGTGGTLSFSTAASSNFVLKVAGLIYVNPGGVFNVGKAGAPIPSTSTAQLLFSVATNVDSGFVVWGSGTLTFEGADGGRSVWYTRLAADAVAGATNLTTSDSTGWLNGDEIALCSTNRTQAQNESKALTANAVGMGLTITALTYAHDGNANCAAVLANMTRNITVSGVSAALSAYGYIYSGAIVGAVLTSFIYFGAASTNKWAVLSIGAAFTTGTITIDRCAFNTCVNSLYAAYQIVTALTFTNNTIYKATSNCLYFNQVYLDDTSATHTVTHNAMIGGALANFIQNRVSATITHNIIGGASTGVFTYHVTQSCVINNNTFISSTYGYSIRPGQFPLIIGVGEVFERIVSPVSGPAIITSPTFKGCTSIVSMAYVSYLTITTPTISTEALYPTDLSGAIVSASMLPQCAINGPILWQGTGTIGYYANQVFSANGIALYLNNCGAVPAFTAISRLPIYAGDGCRIAFQNYNGTIGDHRSYVQGGVIQTSSVAGDYRTSAPGVKITPSSTLVKVGVQAPRQFAVDISTNPTINVYINKKAGYNGAEPRLIAKANASIGLTTERVIDSVPGAADPNGWQLLTGTVLAAGTASDDGVVSVYVDCDGTVGYIAVSDWSKS